MQTISTAPTPQVAALASLLECRDRAREIARQQHDRLRAICANKATRHIKENNHD